MRRRGGPALMKREEETVGKSPAMTITWRRVILGSSLGLCLVALTFLSGLVAEQVRGRKAAAVSRYNDAVQKSRADATNGERVARTRDQTNEAPWTIHIRKAEEALAKKNVSAAEQSWHEAYVAALGSQRWESMVAVGGAARRIGEVAGTREASAARARQIYLVALYRARQQRSVEGVLGTAEAFDALGDREVVNECIRIAESLAGQSDDANTRERVRAFRERSAARSSDTRSPRLVSSEDAPQFPLSSPSPGGRNQ